jgi:predicted Zn-dependent protease
MFGDANGKGAFPIATMNDADRRIVAAQGYLELGLFTEAREELRALPQDVGARPDVIELWMLCEMGDKRWPQALEMARQLCKLRPDKAGGYIHAAYCLHEMGHTRDALDMLLSGPASLQTKAVYHYNLGCYRARLGEMDGAVEALEMAFQKDASLRHAARKDRDLDGLRERLGML